MRKYNQKEKRNAIVLLCLLLALSIGIGYAVLTEKLNIGGTVHYGSITWDVGFSEASDGGGTISSSPSISQDKKTLTVSCNVGTSTKSETCIAKAKIANNSTFAVNLSETPMITYNSTYISSVNAAWTSTSNEIKIGDSIGATTKEEIIITIVTKELSEDILPSESLDIPINITMNWIEAGTSIEEVSFADKTAIFFGDSVAYGHQTNGNGFGYYVNQEEQFLSYKNAAVNTATLNTETQGTNNVIEQMKKNSSTSYDYVIIEGGYGDLRDEPELGSLTDGYVVSEFDTTTFAGAVEYTLYLATTTWEDARIGFIISYDTPNSNYGVRPDHDATKEYWDIVKAACNKWNVEYLDFFEGSTTYNGETKTYSELFDVTGNTYLASDNIHPTALGYEFIAQFITSWMKTLSIYERNFEITENDTTETPSTLTVVESFNDLVFVKDMTAPGAGGTTLTPAWSENSVTGRASAVNYLVAVNGGETVGLSSVASEVTYALVEYDSNKTVINTNNVDGNGQTHHAWLSENITLQSNTRYILVSFKNGDGTTSFTDAQIALLPTYIEFK